MNILKRILVSHITFSIFLAAFVVSLGIVACLRGGEDLKVNLFGAHQTLHHESAYDNPSDPPRPLFRYAPFFAALSYPFILQSKMTELLRFQNLIPSILLWYFVKVLAIAATFAMLFKLSSSPIQTRIRNLKLAFLFAAPMIGYELSAGQNKLLALFFMIGAILCFEYDMLFLSSILLSLAMTIYVPLFCFVFYFAIRKIRYLGYFIAGFLIIFFILPSLAFGFDFNLFLLKEWFLRCLKPFFMTDSYSSYVELRPGSQSLPSAIGRIFVHLSRPHYKFDLKFVPLIYSISPFWIHTIIRACSGTLLLLSCLAVWRVSRKSFPVSNRGLEYCLFLILPLLTPSYCISYTWSWAFVFYFFVMEFTARDELSSFLKKFLSASAVILFFGMASIALPWAKHHSVLCWTTIFFWLALIISVLSIKKDIHTT